MTPNDVCLYHPFFYIFNAFQQWTFRFNSSLRPESFPKRKADPDGLAKAYRFASKVKNALSRVLKSSWAQERI
jgi:hypothetical protein